MLRISRSSNECWPAERKHPFLAAFAVHAERATEGIEVAHLDAGEFASADAEEEQAEQRQAIARVLGDREEPWSCVGRKKWSDTLLGPRTPDARRR